MILKYLNKSKKPIFIAEISGNHCGSLSMAKKLIKTAKKNGANIVKFQTYTADTMTIKSNRSEFILKDGLWKGKTLWNLYNEAHTPFEWHEELFSYSKKIGITCFSTPFDFTAVDLLEKLKCPFYKVASFELTDLPLIKRIAETKKAMIISTGMATLQEIDSAVKVAKKNGCPEIILLYCVSQYPSDIYDFNLENINIMKKKFNCEIGLSDHSNNSIVAKIAVSLGVRLIEKHIALENQRKGVDLKFSLKGNQIKKFIDDVNQVCKILGEKKFIRSKKELLNIKLRRSIYVKQEIKKNDKITYKNIQIIRPANGLDPKYYYKIINKKVKKNLLPGTPLKLNYIEK